MQDEVGEVYKGLVSLGLKEYAIRRCEDSVYLLLYSNRWADHEKLDPFFLKIDDRFKITPSEKWDVEDIRAYGFTPENVGRHIWILDVVYEVITIEPKKS